MKGGGKGGDLSPAEEVAYVALTCALLIGGQYVFSFVAGVEIVTLILVCFSCVFGVRRGVICAVAFSLLRCFLFGFYPTVIILYLVYYPLLAAVSGGLGRIGDGAFSRLPFALAVNALLLGVAAACAALYAFDVIAVSRVYQVTVRVLLWVLFALCVALCAAFDIVLAIVKLRKKEESAALKVIVFTCASAVCTIVFSLLDDVVTPLFYGYTLSAAAAYFYASFLAMLPQTVCAIVTVSTLFLPVTSVLKKRPFRTR